MFSKDFLRRNYFTVLLFHFVLVQAFLRRPTDGSEIIETDDRDHDHRFLFLRMLAFAVFK